jgi:hypothetical protein
VRILSFLVTDNTNMAAILFSEFGAIPVALHVFKIWAFFQQMTEHCVCEGLQHISRGCS